jgi:hypothetical protein
MTTALEQETEVKEVEAEHNWKEAMVSVKEAPKRKPRKDLTI